MTVRVSVHIYNDDKIKMSPCCLDGGRRMIDIAGADIYFSPDQGRKIVSAITGERPIDVEAYRAWRGVG